MKNEVYRGYLLIIQNGNLILNNNYNTYEFIKIEGNSLLDLNKKIGDILQKEVKPFFSKKSEVLDYPLLNDQTIYYDYYYAINDIKIKMENYVSIPLKDAISIINENKYNNPINHLKEETMMEVLKEYVKKNS